MKKFLGLYNDLISLKNQFEIVQKNRQATVSSLLDFSQSSREKMVPPSTSRYIKVKCFTSPLSAPVPARPLVLLAEQIPWEIISRSCIARTMVAGLPIRMIVNPLLLKHARG